MGRPRGFDTDRVLDAAIATFTEHGYASCDARSLCDEAGLARSSFYNTFGSKEALFEQALRRYSDRGRVAAAEMRTATAPAPVLIHERLAGQVLPQCEDDRRAGCLTVNTAVELGRSVADVAAIIDADRADWLATYAEVIRRGQREGHLRRELDPTVHAALLHTTLAGMRVTARIVDEDELRVQIDTFVAGWCTESGRAELLSARKPLQNEEST